MYDDLTDLGKRWFDPTRVNAVRTALRRVGYFPVPIAFRGKGCHMRNWQHFIFEPGAPIAMKIGGIHHPGTGVRCQGICAFDLDIADEEIRDDVRGIIENHCGPTPVVRGRDGSTKLAMFYRAKDGWTNSGDARFRIANRQKLEVYASGGVQLVVDGEHADSTDERRIFYRWEEDPLWDVPLAGLPAVTVPDVKAAVTQAVKLYPPLDGAAASLAGRHEPPQACVRNIVTGQDFHGSTLGLAGHLAAMGWQPDMILTYIDWVYTAIDMASLSPGRQADLEARRADLARCVHDVCARELKRADSDYAKYLTEQELATFRQVNRKR